MIGSLRRINKLRGRSLDEIRVRCSQTLAAYAERRGWSAQTRHLSDAALLGMFEAGGRAAAAAGGGSPPALGTARELLDYFRARPSPPRFFAAFDDREWTLAALRRRTPDGTEAAIVARARRIAAGRFDLLGFRELYFGDPVDWHLEPIAGKRAPLLHWSRIDYLNANVTGDKKITWELNRHQYFVTLGQAYWFTRDERFAQIFVAHLEAWIEANPPKYGINWASSLEVALRAISWLWALHFFRDAPELTPAILLKMLKSLYLHGRHLETYLSTYFSPNTHLTGEALGLFYLGTLLPEWRCAERWRALGRRILLAELDRHVRPDGVYFEQASYYHRYTADFYTHFYILAQANGEAPPARLKARLTALLDHLMYIARPDGTTPFLGDDDGGKLLVLDARTRNDFRATLSTGAALFDRADYKYAAAGEEGAAAVAAETIWLLGRRGVEALDQLAASAPAQDSRAFADGGYYVMRDGWGRDADYLLIDCGPHGTLNCGHAHADVLSFELATRGRTLLVDPGTYTYTGSPALRDFFRSSAAHNTLTIDGESTSVPDGPFTWRHVARARARDWISRRRFDFFEGEHDGYRRLAAPAAHARAVMFLKGDYWIIQDRVTTSGAHRYDLRFHFVPEAELSTGAEDAPAAAADAAAVMRARVGGGGLDLFTFFGGGGGGSSSGSWRAEEGWVSESYGARRRAPVGCFSASGGGGEEEFITFLINNSGASSAQVRVSEIEAAAGGRAFNIHNGTHPDMLLVLGGGEGSGGGRRVVETPRVSSDFQWAWIRFAESGGGGGGGGDAGGHTARPLELVLLGGKSLRIDGVDIVSAAGRAGYVVARRVNDELHVETDARDGIAVEPLGAARVLINAAPANEPPHRGQADGAREYAAAAAASEVR